jgi:hypothetical protein
MAHPLDPQEYITRAGPRGFRAGVISLPPAKHPQNTCRTPELSTAGYQAWGYWCAESPKAKSEEMFLYTSSGRGTHIVSPEKGVPWGYRFQKGYSKTYWVSSNNK